MIEMEIMARRRPPRPTEAELSILQILWKHGPCTVRLVREKLSAKRETGYTTALKFLQIMHEKGLVTRDETGHAHLYESLVKEQQTQQQILGDLLDRVFEGSAAKLAMQALAMKKAGTEERAAIRELLDRLDTEAN